MNFVSKYKIYMLICLPISKDLISKLSKKRETNRTKCNIQLILQKKIDISNGIY